MWDVDPREGRWNHLDWVPNHPSGRGTFEWGILRHARTCVMVDVLKVIHKGAAPGHTACLPPYCVNVFMFCCVHVLCSKLIWFMDSAESWMCFLKPSDPTLNIFVSIDHVIGMCLLCAVWKHNIESFALLFKIIQYLWLIPASCAVSFYLTCFLSVIQWWATS